MTQQIINIGAAPDDHTGDPIRTSFDKTNQNFTELYSQPSGGGSIDAGTTPTTGFNAQQMLVSDGSVIQPVQAGTTINLGDADYPVYMGAFNNTVGINPCITFSGSGYRTADAIAFWTGPYLGISMTGGDNPGVMHQQTFFGFASDTNSVAPTPDTAFTIIKNAVAGFRNLGAPTSPESLRVYNTFSDYSNGEWAAFDWHTVPGTLTLGSQANGSGVLHPVDIVGASLTFNGAPIATSAHIARLEARIAALEALLGR